MEVEGDGDESGEGLEKFTPGGISYLGVFSILNAGCFSDFVIPLLQTLGQYFWWLNI